MMVKEKWLDAAEIADAWRVVPRLILFGYCIWAARLVVYLVRWYTELPLHERTIEASGFAAATITAVTGPATWAAKFYMDSGRDWAAKPALPPAAVQTTTTVTGATP
jgi:hypothetical protein